MRTIVEQFAPVCVMALIIIGSQSLTRRAQRERFRAESMRLRSALIISLQALRRLYEDNLGVLSGGSPPLISGRNQINLLRLQLGRFVLLDAYQIEAVMTATIAIERAETTMAIAGRTVGSVAFTVPEEKHKIATLEAALLRTCALLEAAEQILSPTNMAHNARAPRLETSRQRTALDAPRVRLENGTAG